MRASVPYERPIVARVRVERRPFGGLLLFYPTFLLTLSLVTMIAPQRAGWLAVAQIFGPHLFLPLLLLVPFAFARSRGGLRFLLLACLALFGLRYTPAFSVAATKPDPAASQVSVLTWNAYAGNGHYSNVEKMLAARPADVVVLQEAESGWVEQDDALKEAYPFRLSEPDDAPPGMVVLSAYPIIEHGVLDGDHDLWDIPRLLWVRLDLGNARSVTVVDAHPISAYSMGGRCHLPVCYESIWRDRQITAMRDRYISPMLAAGESLIVAGDFNLTEREPVYADLSRGLTDAWRAAGSGFGTTWRPAFLMEQRLALLRIDYLFSSPGVSPLSISVDCSPRNSDHCVVVGRFQTAR